MLKLLWCLLVVGFPKEPSSIERCRHSFNWIPASDSSEYQTGTCKYCGWSVVKPIDVIDEDEDYEDDEAYFRKEKEEYGC